MDSAGIRTTILTLPAPQPYYGHTEEIRRYIHRVNELSVHIKHQYPGRGNSHTSLAMYEYPAAPPGGGEHASTPHSDRLSAYQGHYSPLRFFPTTGTTPPEVHPSGHGEAELHATYRLRRQPVPPHL